MTNNNWQPYSEGYRLSYRLRGGKAWLLRSPKYWALIVDDLEVEIERFASFDEAIESVLEKASQRIAAIARQRIARLKELESLVRVHDGISKEQS